MLRLTTIRVQRMGPLGAVVIVLAALVLMALAVVLIIPAVVLGVVAAGAFGVRAMGRAMLARMRGPNGALDGRRNVKVIVRE